MVSWVKAQKIKGFFEGVSSTLEGEQSGERRRFHDVEGGEGSGALTTRSIAGTSGMVSAPGSGQGAARRAAFAGMGDILAENLYVEREMQRRDFQRPHGQWVDGVLLEGDPVDDKDLEPFLRRQFRAQQEETRSAAWGAGRTLGRS